MGILLGCWEQMDPGQHGLTAAEIIQSCKEPPDGSVGLYSDLRDALEGLLGKLEARALGTKLRSYHRRVFQGRFIDQVGKEHKSARWVVYTADQFRRRPNTPPTPPHSLDWWGVGGCVLAEGVSTAYEPGL